MSERIFNLPQTKGNFFMVGESTYLDKDNAYVEKKTKNNSMFRAINFGVRCSETEAPISVNINGTVSDKVYFYSHKEKKTEKVNWEDRYRFKKGDYQLIGTSLSIEKDENEKNVPVKIETPYDACGSIRRHLEDGKFVFISGPIEVSSFEDSNTGEKRTASKLIANKIYLQKKDGFEAISDDQKGCRFEQTIVYEDIYPEEDDNNKKTNRFILQAKIVNYNTIETMNFIVEDARLAANIKKKLKPYDAFKVHGYVQMKESVEEVVEDDGWGDQSILNNKKPAVKEFLIVRVAIDTLDTETYSEKSIEDAIKKINENDKAEQSFSIKEDNDDDGWGEDSSIDDEDLPWE